MDALDWLRKHIETDDLMRAMVRPFAQPLMSAETRPRPAGRPGQPTRERSVRLGDQGVDTIATVRRTPEGGSMDMMEALSVAETHFERRLRTVSEGQWELPTPCDEWNVRALVNHVVLGARFYAQLLGGCSRETATAMLEWDIVGDGDALALSIEEEAKCHQAFHAPGALDVVCNHPWGDVPGTMALRNRVCDLLFHTWDLARAVGGDETLPPEPVELVWEYVQAMARRLGPQTGFKDLASGTVDASAPLQVRMLDAWGRRP
jgi:uncharacterized protein (TIGR03086 family)